MCLWFFKSESRSVVSNSETSWDVACQALLAMDFPGKNAGVGCHFLLHWIFPTQGSNLGLPELQVGSLLSGGFPGSSAREESASNAGDPGSIPGLARSAVDGLGYPLQYSWASFIAHLVKNLPEMQETWVWPLGRKDPLAKGTTTHNSFLAWRIPWTRQSHIYFSLPSEPSGKPRNQTNFLTSPIEFWGPPQWSSG